MSIDNMRVGKCYFLTNHGESTSFMVLEAIDKTDYKIKDLLTLEVYQFSDLIKYGKGKDYALNELDC